MPESGETLKTAISTPRTRLQGPRIRRALARICRACARPAEVALGRNNNRTQNITSPRHRDTDGLGPRLWGGGRVQPSWSERETGALSSLPHDAGAVSVIPQALLLPALALT